MALQLKSGKQFTDFAGIIHEEGYMAVYGANVGVGKITLTAGIWKDEAAFMSWSSTLSPQPILQGIEIHIQGTDYITYFRTPISPSIPLIPLQLMNDQFFAFITTEKPTIPLVVVDDWEEVSIPGTPATILHK